MDQTQSEMVILMDVNKGLAAVFSCDISRKPLVHELKFAVSKMYCLNTFQCLEAVVADDDLQIEDINDFDDLGKPIIKSEVGFTANSKTGCGNKKMH